MAAPALRTERAPQPRLTPIEPRLTPVEEFADDRTALRNPRGFTNSPSEPFDVGALTL